MATTDISRKSDLKEWLPRLGYGARGVIYFLVGVLAIMTAIGEGGQVGGSQDAMQTVDDTAFGDVLLGIVGVGLFGYAIWRFVQAIRDPEGRGGDTEAIVARTFMFVSGVIHAGLGVYAFRLAFGGGGGGGQSWSARLMEAPAGPWLVGAAGVAVGAFALYELYAAYRAKFLERLDLSDLSFKSRHTVKRLGQAGLVSRGVVFGIVSWFLIHAAAGAGSAQSAGLGEALRTVASQSYGTILLFLVALGLACFGVFSIVKGYYRQIHWA